MQCNCNCKFKTGDFVYHKLDTERKFKLLVIYTIIYVDEIGYVVKYKLRNPLYDVRDKLIGVGDVVEFHESELVE